MTETSRASADLEVDWQEPGDDKVFWQRDRLHFTDPMPAMEFALMAIAHDQVNWANEHYGLPIRLHYRLIDHYWYYANLPLDLPGEQLEAMGERAVAAIADASANLDRLWNAEWLPEVIEHLRFWETFDLDDADLPRLLEHYDETLVRYTRMWQLHFLQTYPTYVAMSTFEELCRELFADRTAFGPYRLTQGLGSLTYEAGRALWRLSRRAMELPAARRVIEGHPAGTVVDALGANAEGRAFLGELRSYLGRWGKRGEKMGVGFTTWSEDPTPAIKQLQDFLAQPERDVEAEFAGLAEAREQAIAEARARLAGYPAAVRQQFDEALRIAQASTVVTEDHNFLIDFQGLYEVRRVLLALGAQLAAVGALARADDVFYLAPDELRVTASQPAIHQRDVVAERRAKLARAWATTPPHTLGPLPEGPPPTDPVAVTFGKFFGTPPPAAAEPDVLRGHPGSSGRARGRARIIRSLAEADSLRPGDVLVCETTAPPWTPLFASVKAVVTDAGGVLSHSAVVAREYRVPAVVGTVSGTARIRDGQEVEVDGDAGTVRLLEVV